MSDKTVVLYVTLLVCKMVFANNRKRKNDDSNANKTPAKEPLRDTVAKIIIIIIGDAFLLWIL